MKLIKKQFWMPFVTLFLVSVSVVAMVTMIKVTPALPETYFYVSPPEVRDKLPTQTFLTYIYIADAPDTYAWAISLSWNSSLLEWFYIREGSFLNRGAYTTTFTNSSKAEANLNGVVQVSCSLVGEAPWASGSGELVRLGFRVKTYGSSVLNLFDTRLADYLLFGGPAYTYYPNNDGFFFNQPFHNIAVTNVAAQPAIVEPNGLATINVTIKNKGNFTETSTTFNVTVYADIAPYAYEYDPLGKLIKTTVAIGDEITVGTQTVAAPLAIGASTTLTFTWNATCLKKGGDYTTSAEAKGDDDTRDNIIIDGTVYVKIMGDVNGDGIVNSTDLAAVAAAYGSTLGSGNWNEACDFNKDLIINVLDLFILSKKYG